MSDYPRDLVGYGAQTPNPQWPGGAKVALQFVINYEEGGENCILHGDAHSESFLSESVGAAPLMGLRNLSMESVYEFGSRSGVWRLLRLFDKHQVPITCYAVGMAAKRHPEVIKAMVASGHEIASHGLRWIDYQYVSEEVERAHIAECMDILSDVAGGRPLGWYTGRISPQTRRLAAEYGGFLYDADSYADELPYWVLVNGKPELIVPYTLDANDMRFGTPQGFNTGEHFFQYLKDSFDTLYEEGDTAPKMMSVGLHCRLAGRPGRFAGLKRFLDYTKQFEGVWYTRRIDIARHWREKFPYAG